MAGAGVVPATVVVHEADFDHRFLCGEGVAGGGVAGQLGVGVVFGARHLAEGFVGVGQVRLERAVVVAGAGGGGEHAGRVAVLIGIELAGQLVAIVVGVSGDNGG